MENGVNLLLVKLKFVSKLVVLLSSVGIHTAVCGYYKPAPGKATWHRSQVKAYRGNDVRERIVLPRHKAVEDTPPCLQEQSISTSRR